MPLATETPAPVKTAIDFTRSDWISLANPAMSFGAVVELMVFGVQMVCGFVTIPELTRLR